jgi:hypothetical protein
MTQLRWILGLLGGLFTVGWLVIIVLANSFRGSFGASENALWKVVAPPAIALVLTAALIWPERRLLLHTGAIMAAAVLIGSLLLARTTVFTATLGCLYAGSWLLFYYHSLR